MRGMAKMVLVLSAICLCAAAGLSGVYALTKGPIAEAQRQEKIAAISQVMPEGPALSNDPLADVLYINEFDGKVASERPADLAGWRTLHICRRGDQIAGLAMEIASKNGYSGSIKLIVGLDLEGQVLGVRVLQHSETPGLGAKIEQGWFLERLVWVDPKTKAERWSTGNLDRLYVTKDNGAVDAISGATISPRAACEALRQGLELYAQALPKIKQLLKPQPEPPASDATLEGAGDTLHAAMQSFYSRSIAGPQAATEQEAGQ
ncbi:MAG: RnfABCDGE type electron transport complex subunit G [Candidatus Alcyoniella australis]|nr:RnfABCDGE type electron transport complex subunit G [Candidatus Alcyoniella australis]